MTKKSVKNFSGGKEFANFKVISRQHSVGNQLKQCDYYLVAVLYGKYFISCTKTNIALIILDMAIHGGEAILT